MAFLVATMGVATWEYRVTADILCQCV